MTKTEENNKCDTISRTLSKYNIKSQELNGVISKVPNLDDEISNYINLMKTYKVKNESPLEFWGKTKGFISQFMSSFKCNSLNTLVSGIC